MDTPYSLVVLDDVASTQDIARQRLSDAPAVVISHRQHAGRGRAGSDWLTAPRAVAVSIAMDESLAKTGERPVSLMAGLAAARVIGGDVSLKWPNDVLVSGAKAAGILVEASAGGVVVGMGLNLFWPSPPDGAIGVHARDPGPEAVTRIATLWADDLLGLLDAPGWPRDEYISLCSTIGHDIVWEPAGAGRAVGVDHDGALEVRSAGGQERLVAGAVRHVRIADQPRS